MYRRPSVAFYKLKEEFILPTVKKGKRTLEVSEKAYRIYYKEQGYKLVDSESILTNDDVDLFTLSAKELNDNYKVDDLKAFLDKEEIDYTGKTKKEDFIALIVGE